MKVLIDTSFLIEMAKRKVDAFTQIQDITDRQGELCTVQGVFEELERLSVGRTKEALDAKLAFALAKGQNLKTIHGFFKKHPDDALLDAAKGGILATQDKGLKNRAKEQGIQLFTIRQGKYVARA
jgi:rRNA-processing protein FCF1